ncbi:hypothetical protein [Psittacicella hinzii]|uniref:Uncharacterized protein n=1 Tax=Psittacicella hinzii TaxID=2028575 RepID=A0A3A1YQU0_9GAMM|nr:hypothetical protein [Psittacicella hinzii]RIY40015.1 hypothetical protein CKF58_01230 [Psittacicella hinzii]
MAQTKFRAYMLTGLDAARDFAASFTPFVRQFTTVQAVNWASLPPEIPDLFSTEISATQKTQVLSHLRLWQNIALDPSLDEQAWVVIVEQGTALAPHWQRKLDLAIEQVKQQAAQEQAQQAQQNQQEQQEQQPQQESQEQEAANIQGLMPIVHLGHPQFLAWHAKEHEFTESALAKLQVSNLLPINDPVQNYVHEKMANHPLWQYQEPYLQASMLAQANPELAFTGEAYALTKATAKHLANMYLSVNQALASYKQPEFAQDLGKQIDLSLTQILAQCSARVILPSLSVAFSQLTKAQPQVLTDLALAGSLQVVIPSHVEYKEYIKEQVNASLEHWQSLSATQQEFLQTLVQQEVPVFPNDLRLPCQGYNLSSHIQKYVLADQGAFAWRPTSQLSRFYAQAHTADFKLVTLPQVNQAEFQEYLSLQTKQGQLEYLTPHASLNTLRTEFAWGKLLTQVLTDPNLGNHDWVLLSSDNVVLDTHWQQKLNAQLFSLAYQQPETGALVLGTTSERNFKATYAARAGNNALATCAKAEAGYSVLPVAQVNARYTLNAAQALAQTSYQWENNLALTYQPVEVLYGILADNFLAAPTQQALASQANAVEEQDEAAQEQANAEESQTNAAQDQGASLQAPLYLASTEAFMGSLPDSEEFLRLAGVEPSLLSAQDQQRQVELSRLWQVNLAALSAQQVGILRQELEQAANTNSNTNATSDQNSSLQVITRFLQSHTGHNTFPQNGVDSFKRLASKADLQAVKERVFKFMQQNAQRISNEYIDFSQQINTPYTNQDSRTNQDKVVRKQIAQYVDALTPNDYLLGTNSLYSQANTTLSYVWPQAQIISKGEYVLTDWQLIYPRVKWLDDSNSVSSEALSSRSVSATLTPNLLLLNVGALRAKARALAFNTFTFKLEEFRELVLPETKVGQIEPALAINNYMQQFFAQTSPRPSLHQSRDTSMTSLQRFFAQDTARKVGTQDHVSQLHKFVLYDPSAPQALAYFKHQVAPLEFNAQAAVNPNDKQLATKFNTDLFQRLAGYKPTPQAMAQTASHCQLYTQILADDTIGEQDWVLICQTPLMFNQQWRERLNEILSYAKSPYAKHLQLILTQVEQVDTFKPLGDLNLGTHKQLLTYPQEYLIVSDLQDLQLMPTLPAHSNGCYLIRKQALRNAASEFAKPYWLADNFTFVLPFVPFSVAIANPVLAQTNAKLVQAVTHD